MRAEGTGRSKKEQGGANESPGKDAMLRKVEELRYVVVSHHPTYPCSGISHPLSPLVEIHAMVILEISSS